MDIKEYISSGIIETYLLGIATPQEAAELETLRKQYVEVEQAIREAQETMDAFALTHLETPPPQVKENLWAELGLSEKSKDAEEEIIKDVEPTVVRISPFYKYLAAASVALLLGSLIYNYTLNSKLDAMRADIEALNAKDRAAAEQLSAANQQISVLKNPNSKHIRLEGTEKFKGNLAGVIWDSQSKEVYLQMHQMVNLPSDKQYQLWAIVDGQPVDLGVYQSGTAMQKMKNVDGAQLFAITIEKAGGSPVPTLEQMIVAGGV